MNLGAVYRALPGETKASPGSARKPAISAWCWASWPISPADTCGSATTRHQCLSEDFLAQDRSADEKTYELPGGGFCNDIALKGKDAYITDTKGGRVLKLAGGSDALTVWYTNDATDTSLDGLVWQGDALYTNTYNGNHLIRISVNADGVGGQGREPCHLDGHLPARRHAPVE